METTPKLTVVHDTETLNKIAATFPGMATWAGTGPANMTCRSCSQWACRGYYAKSNKETPHALRVGGCRKLRELSGRIKIKVPHFARACRFYEQNDNPPPVRNV